MEPPACDPGGMAQCAESTLFIPEIAKSTGTPKRFQHVSPFPFFEVSFIGWIVRVGPAVWQLGRRAYFYSCRNID